MAEILQYDFFINSLIAAILLGISCGLIGTYIVAKRMVFISGGITHSSFGGLGIAYYLGFSPILGALIFAIISAMGIQYFSNKKIREDSLIGIFWSAGMAVGMLFIFLTAGYAPNIMSYLFGNILTVTTSQLITYGVLCLTVVCFFGLFNRTIFYMAFNREYARTHHINVVGIETIVMIMIAVCIVLSMKLAGIILIISYLTIPQSIAGIFFSNFRQILLWSTIISTIGSILGLCISAYIGIPSGIAVVLCFLCLFAIARLSLIFKRRRSNK